MLLVGWQEGHMACQNWVVRYWRDYLSRARCKWFAYGPADATATPLSLAPVKSRVVYFLMVNKSLLPIKVLPLLIIQSGHWSHSNLTQSCIAAADGWFSRIRHVEQMCNPVKYMLPTAHARPCPKWHLDRFSHFCTTHGKESLYCATGHPFPPQNCPFVWGYLNPDMVP